MPRQIYGGNRPTPLPFSGWVKSKKRLGEELPVRSVISRVFFNKKYNSSQISDANVS